VPLLTSAPISALAIELLRRSLVLPSTVARVADTEYAGPSGGTVTLRVPQPRTVREQVTPSAPITFDDVDEHPVNVVVRHLYNAARVSDKDLSLGIEDFGRQILRPQVAAVADGAEDLLGTAMNAVPADAAIKWAAVADPGADLATLLAIREALTVNGVEAASRYLAVAPNIATRLLSVPQFAHADERGGTSAIDEAIIGRVFGLTVVESAAITPGSSVGYHSSGFAFGNLAPAPPPGGVDSTSANESGVALRHILSFDATRLATASVVSVFAGATVISEDDVATISRAIRVTTATA
jgi:hypothetical protein